MSTPGWRRRTRLVPSSTQNRQPSGAGGHSCGGCQSGGGDQPADTGQPGGALNFGPGIDSTSPSSLTATPGLLKGWCRDSLAHALLWLWQLLHMRIDELADGVSPVLPMAETEIVPNPSIRNYSGVASAW